MFVFFVNHRYDLTYYLRLLDNLNLPKNKIKFIFNKRFSDQKDINVFIKNELNFKIQIIDFKEESSSKLQRLLNFKKLDKFLNKISNNFTLIILDKSKLSSRYLISKFSKVILIQNNEDFNNYKLNIKETIKELFKSIITQTIPVLIYSDETKFSKLVYTFKIYDKYIIKSNFSLLPRVKINKDDEGMIVLFGSRFYNWNFINQNSIEEFVKKIILHIVSLNPNKKINYLSHPRESGKEISFLKKNLGSSLVIHKNYLNAEHFLIKNHNVVKTYSIGSTASISAHHMGFKSYVFYKMLKIKKSNISAFDNVLRNLPKNSFLEIFNLERQYEILENFDPSLINLINKYDKEY